MRAPKVMGGFYIGMHSGTPRYAADPTALEPLLTVRGVCDVLRVSKQTVYRLTARGELPSTRVGDRLRFAPADIREYVERNREPVQ